jgi:hypothetical protein
MIFMLNLLYTIIFVFITSGLNAQEDVKTKLSLEQCIDLAVKNNLEIKLEDSNVELYTEKKKFVEGKKILPQFTMEHLTGPIPDAEGDIFTDPSEFDLGIDRITKELGVFYRLDIKAVQPIYTFGKITSLGNIASLGVDIAQLKKREKKADIISKVSMVYHLINMLGNLQDIIDEGKEKLGEAKKKVSELLNKGSTKVSIFDEYKIEVFELELAKQELEIKGKRSIAFDGLKTLMGVDYGFDIVEMQSVK